MNYFKQVYAFYELQIIDNLSTGQIALFHALLHINNKTMWSEWFSVANASVEILTGLSRQGVQKARNALKEKGIIEFEFQGTKATKYKLKKLYSDNAFEESSQKSSQDSYQESSRKSSEIVTEKLSKKLQKSSTLIDIRHKTKTKDNNAVVGNINNELSMLIDFYQNNFGIAAPITIQSIENWLLDLPSDLILEAMTKASKNNKAFSYAEAIMRSWTKKGIDTLEKAKAEQVAFDNSRNNRYKQQKTVTLSNQERDELNAVDTPLSDEELAELKALMN